MGKRNKKTAVQVLNRLMALCEYFNSIKHGVCNESNEVLMDDLGYSNRKQLKRDLDRLEDMDYIRQRIDVKTPSKVESGTATQYVRKYRKIFFMPSKDGLLAFPTKLKAGDKIGESMYNGEIIPHYKEDLERAADGSYIDTDSDWVIGPDHTLIKRNK